MLSHDSGRCTQVLWWGGEELGQGYLKANRLKEVVLHQGCSQAQQHFEGDNLLAGSYNWKG